MGARHMRRPHLAGITLLVQLHGEGMGKYARQRIGSLEMKIHHLGIIGHVHRVHTHACPIIESGKEREEAAAHMKQQIVHVQHE